MKYDLESEERSVLYESKEDLLLSKCGTEVMFHNSSGINALDADFGYDPLMPNADGEWIQAFYKKEGIGGVILIKEKR